MSYFDSKLDIAFREKISKPYLNLSKQELLDLCYSIFVRNLPSDSRVDGRISKKVFDEFIFKTFNSKLNYKDVALKALLSKFILELFKSEKSLHSFNNPDKLKGFVLMKSRRNYLKRRIENYIKREKIPREFVELIYTPDCLTVLTSYFLKRVFNKKLDPSTFNAIKALNKELTANKQLETPYNRVSEYRKFLVELSRSDGDYNIIIPKPLMRIVLSTCRLFFSYQDELKCHANYLKSVIDKSYLDLDYYNYQETIYADQFNNSKILRWKSRHLLPIFSNEKDIHDVIVGFDQVYEIPSDVFLKPKALFLASYVSIDT